MMIGTRTPMPEMLIRKDGQDGAWQINDCDPVRGKPFTNIVDRLMAVPHHDDEVARCIRAHEMMHARVSPVDGFVRWAERGVATPTALQVVEEVRVNILCERAGFDVKKHLGDGSELAAGERAAATGDWAGAVYTAVAFANTAGLNQFITGVRRTQPEWAAALRGVAERVIKEMKKVKGNDLGATDVDPRSGLSPIGFTHTERLAEMVDRIANPPQPEGDDAQDGRGQDGNEAKNDAKDGQDEADGNAKGRKRERPQGDKAPVDAEQIKKMNPVGNEGGPIRWPELRVERCPLGRRAPGGMGKKRRAANIGRNPRRVHRMITDPDRRIFDAKTKGNGGVVLIDGSASVNFSQADIQRMLEAAPGATVAVYAAKDFEQEKNLWVLADKGRMVSTLPERVKANGVDYPALVWAVDQRQHPTAPVVWITDGEVHPPSGGRGNMADTMCMNYAIKHGVLMRPTAKSAVEALTDLARGRKVGAWWPRGWRSLYRRLQGTTLRSVEISRDRW